MSWIADAHREWHLIHGANNASCPLDCGVGEYYYDEPEPTHIVTIGDKRYNCFSRQQAHDFARDLARSEGKTALVTTA